MGIGASATERRVTKTAESATAYAPDARSGDSAHAPRVLLDVDGVLADFVGAYLDLVRGATGRIHTPEQVTGFDIASSLGLCSYERAATNKLLVATERFARDLEIYPGAVEGVNRLRAVADVYIVTSPWNSHPTWTHDREVWLKEHFDIPAGRVVHASAKHLVRGDFLVDDKTSTLVSWQDEHPNGVAVQWRTLHNRRDGWTGRSTDRWDELVALVSAKARLAAADAVMSAALDELVENTPESIDHRFDLGGEG